METSEEHAREEEEEEFGTGLASEGGRAGRRLFHDDVRAVPCVRGESLAGAK